MTPYPTPGELYGELFTDVQSNRLFADSKTFADAIPKQEPSVILRRYRRQRRQAGFDLKTFVLDHFDLPPSPARDVTAGRSLPIREHIDLLWHLLERDADRIARPSSLIALPNPYIVPGGRFSEIYYWDSYFTMLGLAEAGRLRMVENMLDNFAFLLRQLGLIPNGNRSYYRGRSQPPLFALMVELLAEKTADDGVYARYLPALLQEYDFWMAGGDSLQHPGDCYRRAVRVNRGVLNRHWDDDSGPRQESYHEDTALAAGSGREPAGLFRDIRAACETGWDFSSRWFAAVDDPASIRTTQILPVDLNAALYKLESMLARACGMAGDALRQTQYQQRADLRKSLIQELFFDASSGLFCDLLLPQLTPSHRFSLAAMYPLFFGLATAEQAGKVADRMRGEFLRPGGWLTTTQRSGQQWDAPNGWAPLQWITYIGLRNYGFDADAETGARRWVENNLAVYGKTGGLVEKYDVEQIGKPAGGGEYVVQHGFGWTNAVLLKLMNDLGIDA